MTTDGLLGIENRSDAELIEIVYENTGNGKIAENIELLRNAVKQSAGNFELWRLLAGALTSLRTDTETAKRNNAEAIEIYERILAHSTDSAVRNRTQTELCYAYAEAGERAKAAAIAKTLPTVWFSQAILADFLDGKEKRSAISNNFLNLTDALDWQFYRLLQSGELTSEEKVKICEKSLALFDLIFEEGELLHLAVNVSERNLWLAKEYCKLGRTDDAIAALEKSIKYAKEYDNQPQKYLYQSLLLRGLPFEKSFYGKDYAEPWSYWLLKYMQAPEFDALRGDARYEALCKALR